jgi:hypothetical protein
VLDDHPETLPAPGEKVVVGVLEVRFLKFKDADRVAHAYVSLKAGRKLNRGTLVRGLKEQVFLLTPIPLNKKGFR